MVRLKVDALGRPWEKWSGFTRSQVLADDPADGFDLPGYAAYSSNENLRLSSEMRKFINDNGMDVFLP